MRTIYVSKKLLGFLAVLGGSIALLAAASAANENAQPTYAAATTSACVSINPVDVDELVVESNRQKLAEVQEWLDAQTAPATTDTAAQAQQPAAPSASSSHGTSNAATPPNPDDYDCADDYADDCEGWFASHGYANPYDDAYQYWEDNEYGWDGN